MLPKEIADKAGKNRLSTDMVIGTGPYKLVEHKVDRYLRFQRWDKFARVTNPPMVWQESVLPTWTSCCSCRCPKPRYGLTVSPPASTTLPRRLSPTNTPISRTARAFRHSGKPSSQVGPHFNKKQGLFTDVRLRRAAMYAVDLEQIMIAGFGRKEFFRLGRRWRRRRRHGIAMWAGRCISMIRTRPNISCARQAITESRYAGCRPRNIFTCTIWACPSRISSAR